MFRLYTKTQISHAVPAQLLSAFVFVRGVAQFLFFLIKHFKLPAIVCKCTDRFVSHLKVRRKLQIFLRKIAFMAHKDHFNFYYPLIVVNFEYHNVN